MQSDYEVLQKMRENRESSVVPKRQLTDVSTDKTDLRPQTIALDSKLTEGAMIC